MTLDDLGDQGGVGESHSLERLGVLFFFPTSQPFVIQLKERWAYRSRNIGTGDSLRRSVKVVESGRLADLGNDLGTDTECYATKKKKEKKKIR